jgi:diacylglycerol O-acyltransferase
MSYTHYDRLSAMDAAFLELEDGNAHMHIGSVAIFEAAPLATPEGGIDFERILEAQESSLRTTIRFRQKLAWVPRIDHPVWVDDPNFNLSYHMRHTALPAPGSVRQLKRLAGRIMSQQLDRGKPLWECWYVEGLEGGRFAMITKLHHCLADGISGTELFAGMMGPNPQHRADPPQPFVPRPAPSGARLLADEMSRRARLPWELLRAGGRAAASAPRSVSALRDLARALGDSFAAGLSPASETPFNVDLGPHRRFDWTRFDLDAMREVKEHFGCKLNDVVLSVVAGAVRRFLRGRGLRPEGMDFRAMIPVNVRSHAQRGALGNRVSQMLARLPVDEADPTRRLERVVEVTRELKRSSQVAGLDHLTELADWSGTGLISRLARMGLSARAVNLVVTNVPGPPVPLYLVGAPLLEVYPVVPLGQNQALGIALFSYAGGFHWGFNADWDALPDLHHLVEAVDVEFEALRKAGARGPRPQDGGGA